MSHEPTLADEYKAERDEFENEVIALKAQNAELVLGMQEIFNEAGPACTPNDWPKLHNIRLLAKATLGKVSK